MQIVTPGGCGAHEEGEFYDTLSGPTCTVRFKAVDFGQRMIMVNGSEFMTYESLFYVNNQLKPNYISSHFVFLQHCHVLSHEDNGAISWM